MTLILTCDRHLSLFGNQSPNISETVAGALKQYLLISTMRQIILMKKQNVVHSFLAHDK
jgi:hypothetical protein